MAELRRSCELCDGEAHVYCVADSALLCVECDEKVHCENFLVAQHVRVRVCPQCHTHAGVKNDCSSMGVLALGNMKMVGESCSCFPQVEEEVDDDCLSSSSSCVSSTTGEEAEVGVISSSSTSSRRKRINRRRMVMDGKVEGVLVNWSRTVRLEDKRVVKTAVDILSSVGKTTMLPFRVLLAAAFWAAMSLHTPRTATWHDLKTLEQISGVSARLITAVQTRVARVNKRRQSRDNREESWAEC
ncbi:hypothetical protein RND81_05G237900 [Saponaria officinalis]|uniref:B box-type domain-containing protein n=1 Tax=Saponaria officinalis TaxID=3572 RepID=A0AAW1L3A9_SAPOF